MFHLIVIADKKCNRPEQTTGLFEDGIRAPIQGLGKGVLIGSRLSHSGAKAMNLGGLE